MRQVSQRTIDKNFQEFINNNKYLRDKKYHKGIGFSQVIFGSSGSCRICKADSSEHVITHNRKTDGKEIHRGYICSDCGRKIQNILDQSYWKSVEKKKEKRKKEEH